MNRKPIVLDCSLRDGGYYNYWDFPKELVRKYLATMGSVAVDVVEIGFRSFSDGTFQGAHAFSTDEYLRGLPLPEGVAIAVMVNAKTLVTHPGGPAAAVDLLFAPASESPVSLVRVAAHMKELDRCEAAVRRLDELGYQVGLNLMQASGFSGQALADAVRKLASWPIRVLYFADSLGRMDAAAVADVFRAFRSAWPGDIGFHAHDNMLNGLPNAVAAIGLGSAWVDGTVRGIGRGAGNVQLEYLLLALNEQYGTGYDMAHLIDFAEGDFARYQRECGWGPNPLYYLAAQSGVHPTYVQEMLSDRRYTTADIMGAIEFLGREAPGTFRADALEPAALHRNTGAAGGWRATGWAAGRDVLLLGTGSGVERYREALAAFIDRARPVVLALNVAHTFGQDRITAYVSCHPHRIMMEAKQFLALRRPMVTPFALLSERLRAELAERGALDYGMVVEDGPFRFEPNGCSVPSPLAAPYGLALATSAGAERILLAGFDGFDRSDPRQTEMSDLLDLYQRSPGARPLLAITPTSYPVPHSSVFAPDL